MSLIHGTSLENVLKIIHNGPTAHNGKFYCFDSSWPEAYSGAICFATGDGLRNGDLNVKKVFQTYCKLNPDFPTGFKGLLIMLALKFAASAWSKEQKKQIKTEKDLSPAIIEFEYISESIHIKRANIINEIVIPELNLNKLKITKIWIENKYFEDIKTITPSNIVISSISDLFPHKKNIKNKIF